MNNSIYDYYKNLYKSEQEAFNANGHKYQHLYKGRVDLVKDMVKSINCNTDIVVLDAGCGNGLFFHDAISSSIANDKADGIDLLQEAVDLAKDKYRSIACGSTVELTKFFEKETYDLVNSMEIYSYIKPEDRAQFFADHAAVLKKGGYFLLTVTNLDSLYRKIVKPEPELFPYYFDEASILHVASEESSLELIAVKGVDIFNIIHNSTSLSNFFLYELSFLFRKL